MDVGNEITHLGRMGVFKYEQGMGFMGVLRTYNQLRLLFHGGTNQALVVIVESPNEF